VICLRDIFYNVCVFNIFIDLQSNEINKLPIRRTAHVPPHKTLELVKREMETYALVFPEISFTLDDASRLREGNTTNRLLNIPKVCLRHTESAGFNCCRRHPLSLPFGTYMVVDLLRFVIPTVPIFNLLNRFSTWRRLLSRQGRCLFLDLSVFMAPFLRYVIIGA
jgi:hypothetical protein